MNEIRTLEVEFSRKEVTEADQSYLEHVLQERVDAWRDELMEEGLDMANTFTIETGFPDQLTEPDVFKALVAVEVWPSTEPEVTVDWGGPAVLPSI